MYAVYEHVLCVIYVKYAEVLHPSVVVWYMGDEYEESYEDCIGRKKMYVFI